MDQLQEERKNEFQAVIIVESDDGRMYPIVEDSCPKCLLPVANRELLSYQLDMLNKSGVTEVYIAAPTEYQQILSQFIRNRGSNQSQTTDSNWPMSVELVIVENMTGSADGLRAIAERLRGDFICMSSDIFIKSPLGPLVNHHRNKSSDVTILLSSAPFDEEITKTGDIKRKIRIDDDDREIMAFNDDNRLVIKLPLVDVEADSEKNDNCINIHKALLNHSGNIALRTDLMDLNVYIFSYWCLEFLKDNNNKTKFVSISADFIPFVIKRQYQPSHEILLEIPAIRNRQKTLASIEPWLIASNSAPIDNNEGKHFELIDFLIAEKDKTDNFTGGVSTCLIPDLYLNETLQNNSLIGGGSGAGGLNRIDTLKSVDSYDPDNNNNNNNNNNGNGNSNNNSNGNSNNNNNNGNGNKHNNSPNTKSNTRGTTVVGGINGNGHTQIIPELDYTTVDNVSVKDILRCYAYIHENDNYITLKNSCHSSSAMEHTHTFIPSSMNPTPIDTNKIPSGPCLMLRLTSINNYINLNKELPTDVYNRDTTPWPRLQGYQKKEQSIIGDKFDSKEKVTIKTCTIGNNCNIGCKTKLNNTIIMSNVTIGDNVIIQNSVICSGVTIESNCNLNEVCIGVNVTVRAGTKLKGESIGADA